MTWVALILLAVVQGATEFLPISSSGHLSLAHALFGSGEEDVLVDIVLHVGTLVAVLVVYRAALVEMIRGAFAGLLKARKDGVRSTWEDERVRLLAYVLIGSVVTGVVGLGLKDLVEGVLRGPVAVGSMLLLNGGILWTCRRLQQPDETVELGLAHGLTVRRALLIGLLQGLAVTPGISRSGTTITGALHMGVPGAQAARFSFLLSIPAILGALLLKIGDVANSGHDVNMGQLLVGAAVAAVVGWLCLVLLLKLLNRARFHHFSWYCWTVGAIALGWGLFG